MMFSRPSPEQSFRVHLLKVVVAAMASMFLIAAGSIGWNAWSEHKVAEAEIARMVHTISAGLDDSLLMTIAALESLAATLEEEGRPETLRTIASAIKSKRPEWSEVMLRNATGEVIFTTAQPPASSVAQTGQRTLWVKEAMARGGLQISDLLYSEALNTNVAVVLLPVVTKDGARFGLTASIPADKWTRLLQGLPIPTGWVANILDRNGVIIARTRRASEYVGTKAPEWLLDAIRVAPDGLVEGHGIEGERLTAAYTRSNVSGWTIVFAAPTSAMWAPLRRALITAVAVNGLVLGIGLLMVSTFARRLSRSMDWLARAADRVIVPSSSVVVAPSPMAREFNSVYEAIRRVSAHFTAAKERQLTSMRELHHRVGNEIQAITSFISMAGGASQSEECRRVLSDLEGRIDIIHVAHAQLDGGGDVDAVELGAFLSEVCSRSIALFDSRSGGRIAFRAHTDRTHVRHDIAVSLGLIANEFVTNSAKHAFPQRPGTISLRLKAIEARRITITLSDDGAGISTENHRSSGLRLIAGLAEHVGADAEWDVDGGTKLRLQLCGSFAPVQEPAVASEKFQDTSATAEALPG